MCDSNAVNLCVNDLFHDLFDENNRLLIEVKFAFHLIELLRNYRSFVHNLSANYHPLDQFKHNRVFDDLELKYKTLFADQILDDIITRSEDTLKSDTSVGNGIKGKHKRMVRLKTNEDNKSADDLTTGPQLGLNDIINETLVGVKRSQRLDFIEPKPIFGDKSADNKDLVDNEEVVDSGCEETDGTSGMRVRATISGYLCEYPNCDYMNGNKGNVSRHISKMHLNKRPLVCDDCGQTFWGQKRLFLHRKATHFASLVDSGNRRQYKCDWHDCTYQCKSLTNLNLHRRRHSGQKPFKCQFPDCVSSFVTNSELKTHTISIHSNESPFKCEWSGCGHAFKTKERLKCHSYNHNNEWPYVCEWPGCDAKYAKNSDLKMHRLCIHSNDKPYPCEWPACEARFKTKNGRRLHNYTHTGERPYRCEWPGCEASYYMVSKLNRHKLSHNGIKNYRCLWPDCDMKYSTSHNLKLHLMVHRNERPFVCDFPLCERRFTDKSQMRRHSKKVHKTISQNNL